MEPRSIRVTSELMLFARRIRFQVREETSLPINPMDNSLLVEDQRLCPTDIPSCWTWRKFVSNPEDHERHTPQWVARCGAREFSWEVIPER
jgi:hypothetical protein